MPSHLDNPIFHDEAAAREWFKARIWPDGPFCPHCGSTTVTRLHGKAHRPGLFQCNDCREQFTVNTVCERSKIPLSKWCMAIYLLNSSKKGMPALQMHRMVYDAPHPRGNARRQTAGWAWRAEQVVEADETYVGGKARNRKNKVPPKAIVLALVERDGSVRSFRVPNVSAESLRPVIVANVSSATSLMTDESPSYVALGREFKGHGSVNHSAEEYVRAQFWHTNTVEGYFSSLKRGIIGIYHHVSETHLHRYSAEFDLRYNHRMALGYTDMQRTEIAAAGIYGKRLTYRRPDQRPNV